MINVWQYTRGIQGEVVLLEVIKFLSKTAKIAATIFLVVSAIYERRCDLPGCDRPHDSRHLLGHHQRSSTTTPLALVVDPLSLSDVTTTPASGNVCFFVSNSWPPTLFPAPLTMK